MANKKISELPYINSGEISGNTLVPLVTYFSAATGDTVHTYITDLQNYLTSGITGSTASGNYLPLSGGTVSGATRFLSGLTANTISADTLTVTDNISSTNRTLYRAPSGGFLESVDYGNSKLWSVYAPSIDWELRQIYDEQATMAINYSGITRYLMDDTGQTSVDWQARKLYTFIGEEVFDWENGILTGQTNIQSSTISATTYLNLPNGYYNSTGITSSQSITWDKTYWGISGSSNVDITLPSTTSKDGHILIIKDESGLAGSYRIRVTPLSGTIDGNTYIDMNINYMSLTFVARNNNWWII